MNRQEEKSQRSRIRQRIRKLAGQGRLMDEAFTAARTVIYPNAKPYQIEVMRTMFFAGASEFCSLQMHSLSEGEETTLADEITFGQIVAEINKVHGQNVQSALARNGQVQ